MPLVGLFVAGCAVDQQAEVDLYRQVLDGRIAKTPPYVDGERLSLVRAMALANQHNEQLAVRGEDYLQALITKNRVVANFLPTVSFQPSFTVEQRAENGAPSGVTGTTVTTGGSFRNSGDISYRTEAPVVGSINLYRGGADVANLRSAEANIDYRRLLLLDAQSTVLLNVAQVYLQVLRSERAVQVLRNSVALQEARLKDVKDQFANQLATKLAVAQTQAQVNGTRAILVQAESDVRNGRHALALLVGVDRIDGELSEQSVTDVVSDSKLPLSDYERVALDRREDLAAARAAVVSAREQVDVAFAQYYPSVSLNVSGFLYREFFADASKWNAILYANLPIFSAGIIEADVRSAWSRLRQAALNESFIYRQVLNDVRTAYENLDATDRKTTEIQQQVEASREALEQARAAFLNQLAINLDVLVAQDQLLNAELQLTGVRFDRAVFLLDLTRAIGQLHELTHQPATRPTTAPATSPFSLPTTQPAP